MSPPAPSTAPPAAPPAAPPPAEKTTAETAEKTTAETNPKEPKKDEIQQAAETTTAEETTTKTAPNKDATENKNIKLDPGEDFALIEKAAILLTLHDPEVKDDNSNFVNTFEDWVETIMKKMKTNEIMDKLGHKMAGDKGVSKKALRTALKELENKHKKFFNEKKKIVKEKKGEIRKRENFVNRGLKIFGRWGHISKTAKLMDKVVIDYITWLKNNANQRTPIIKITEEQKAKTTAEKEEEEAKVIQLVKSEINKTNQGGGGDMYDYVTDLDKRALYFHVVKNHKATYFNTEETLYGKEKDWKKRKQKLINFIAYLKTWVRKAWEKAPDPKKTFEAIIGEPVAGPVEVPFTQDVQQVEGQLMPEVQAVPAPATGGRKKTSKIHIYLGTKPPKKKKTRKKPKKKPKKKKKKPKKKPKRKKGVRGKSPPTKKRNKKKLNNKNKKTRRNKKK